VPRRPPAQSSAIERAQVKKISVKQITSPIIFDNVKNAVPGGLHDAALGPMDPKER
jgi:hypothetical protein